MLYINNNRIAITRGDTGNIILTINQGNELYPSSYVMKDTDKIYFAIEEANQPFENAIVKKILNKDRQRNGKIKIKLNSEDTMCLIPGKYFLEIKLVGIDEFEDEEIQTIIPQTEFYIE